MDVNFVYVAEKCIYCVQIALLFIIRHNRISSYKFLPDEIIIIIIH